MSFSVDLIGPYPPPYGGVSVHIERLAQRLRAAGHEVHTHPPQQAGETFFQAFRRVQRTCRGDIQHFHSAVPYDAGTIGWLSLRGRRCVLTIHGQMLEIHLEAWRGLWSALLVFLMRRISAVVAVNGHIRDFALSGIGLPPDRVFEIPAFLPPDAASVRTTSPGEDVEAFLRKHEPVLAANAWTLDDHEGVPLYGSDLMVDLLGRLRGRLPDTGLLFYLSSIPAEQEPLLAALRARLDEAGLAEHYRIVLGSRLFTPALARSSVLLRPTNTDGDALSVREALWLGVPVIASDVVERPAGTELFRTRDAESLWQTTLRVCSDLPAARARLAGAARSDGFESLLAVYRRVLAD